MVSTNQGEMGRFPPNKVRIVEESINRDPWVHIVEQPKARGLRFRYECEGRCAGSIPGEHSTNDHKTFPTIQVHNYKGPAVVVVSLVTKDDRPRPHPHSLVGKDCKKGVCTMKFHNNDMRLPFPNLGIQCAKKKDIPSALETRKQIRVDPFCTGFDIRANQVDLQTVRLCFQVFLPNPQSGQFSRILNPVVSNCIYDKKAAGDLTICRIDKVAGSARGNDEVFVFCEKVSKDDIKIKFFEESSSWEEFAIFAQTDVHRSFAIAFRTPAYKDPNIKEGTEVYFQLFRPSDGETSAPMCFTYKPDENDAEYIIAKKKRKKVLTGLLGMPESFNTDTTNPAPCNPEVISRVRLKAERNRVKNKIAAASSTDSSPYQVTYDESTGTAKIDLPEGDGQNNVDGSVTFEVPVTEYGEFSFLTYLNGVHGPPGTEDVNNTIEVSTAPTVKSSHEMMDLNTPKIPSVGNLDSLRHFMFKSSDINITSGDLTRILELTRTGDGHAVSENVAAQETVETSLNEGEGVLDFLRNSSDKK